jgi:hypothetical protein
MQRPIDFSRSGPYFASLFVVALVAFWPTYLALAPSASSAYTHLHAFTAAIWILMLVAQPLAIRTRRMPLHRLLGRASYALAPLMLVSIVLLAHSRIRGLQGEAYGAQTYVLYLQVSLAVLFGIAYGLAILAIHWRQSVTLHARFMLCTALTLIDPVVIRLLLWANPAPSWNYQWLTFGLTDAVFVVLIWLDRHSSVGRVVLPTMLGLFMIAQAPALFGLTNTPAWQKFARWFAALPMT